MILELTVVIIVSTFLFGYYWEYIVQFMAEHIIPWIRQNLSNTLGDLLADLFSFLDGKMVPIKRMLKKLWTNFKENILGFKTEYTKIDTNTARKQTETFIRKDDNKVVKRVETEEIEWKDIPEEIREKMIQENVRKSKLDDLKIIEDKMRRRCEEEDILVQEIGVAN